MKKSLGLYLHIPFCLQKCYYCDFCSFSGNTEERMASYVEELCRRMAGMAPSAADSVVDTVYFGGGTPTLLPLSCFERLLSLIRERYEVSENCEITCECNPATADLDKLRGLRSLGIDRLSIGLQSAHDRELALLGRAHSFADFERIFSDARRAGFDNLSADLMYGIPEQTLESFRHSLEQLRALAPEHISAYGLKIEEGTPFFFRRDRLRLPDEDTEYAMYLLCGELLGERGYEKYEISNFARKGRESRHNLRYWLGEEYLGFGVAAHSCFGGVRFGNSRDMAGFLGGQDITAERTVLTERDRFNEYVMLRLRLTRGIDGADFFRRFGQTPREAFPQLGALIQGGLIREREGRYSFTDHGFFVSNAILAQLLRFD